MEHNDMKRYALSDEHFDVDWERQRVLIDEHIDARRTPPAWQWAIVAATTAAIAFAAWFGAHQLSIAPHRAQSYTQLEKEVDEVIAGQLPTSLVALNGWTDVEFDDDNYIPASLSPLNNDSTNTTEGEKEAL